MVARQVGRFDQAIHMEQGRSASPTEKSKIGLDFAVRPGARRIKTFGVAIDRSFP
jgi:hypothetical protein